MSFLDSLLNRPSLEPAKITPAEVGQPVPIAYLREPPSDLTSGSDLNEAAVGAWPTLIDGGAKFWNGGWRKSKLKEISTVRVSGNYGAETSQAHYGFLYRAFTGIGNHSGPIPNPYRPTFNNLTAVTWGLRVDNPNTPSYTTAQKGPITIQTTPSTWQGASTASLTKTGETLL
jgi:hypothetical protein